MCNVYQSKLNFLDFYNTLQILSIIPITYPSPTHSSTILPSPVSFLNCTSFMNVHRPAVLYHAREIRFVAKRNLFGLPHTPHSRDTHKKESTGWSVTYLLLVYFKKPNCSNQTFADQTNQPTDRHQKKRTGEKIEIEHDGMHTAMLWV